MGPSIKNSILKSSLHMWMPTCRNNDMSEVTQRLGEEAGHFGKAISVVRSDHAASF